MSARVEAAGGVTQQADVSMIEATIRHLKQRIDYRLNDHLCDMKEGWDDSVTGFNEAWDVVRAVLDDSSANLAATMAMAAVRSPSPRDQACSAMLGALERLANAADDVGVSFFDTDTMSAEVSEMQAATERARAVASSARSAGIEPLALPVEGKVMT
ncbi:hypothetical protein [Reyranella sp.]|uniref:hypothetical protein n=1 Tax=Reyranella sp. TaxID=1929291 RepID=UPI00121C865A|nr:hypothetical protein [Reyranella sp.]TAJ89696.1 MAG: hypothetical protein EPO50_04855 [Reyranella sp.]